MVLKGKQEAKEEIYTQRIFDDAKEEKSKIYWMTMN